jgi:hypothetical protein
MEKIAVEKRAKVLDKKARVLSSEDMTNLSKYFSPQELAALTPQQKLAAAEKLGTTRGDFLGATLEAIPKLANVADIPPAAMRTAIYGKASNLANPEFYKKGIESGFPTVQQMLEPDSEDLNKSPLTKEETQRLLASGVPYETISQLTKEDLIKAFPERAYKGNLLAMPVKQLFETIPEGAKPFLDFVLTGATDPFLATGLAAKSPKLLPKGKEAAGLAKKLTEKSRTLNPSAYLGGAVDTLAELYYRAPDFVQRVFGSGTDNAVMGGTRGSLKGERVIAPSKVAYQQGQLTSSPRAYQNTTDKLQEEAINLLSSPEQAATKVRTDLPRSYGQSAAREHRKLYSGIPSEKEGSLLNQVFTKTVDPAEIENEILKKQYISERMAYDEALKSRRAEINRLKKQDLKKAKDAEKEYKKINNVGSQTSLEKFEDIQKTVPTEINYVAGAEKQPVGPFQAPSPSLKVDNMFPLNQLRKKSVTVDPAISGWGNVAPSKSGQLSFINMGQDIPFISLEDFKKSKGVNAPRTGKELAEALPSPQKPKYTPVSKSGIPLQTAIERKKDLANKINRGQFVEAIENAVDAAASPSNKGELRRLNQSMRSTIEAGKRKNNPLDVFNLFGVSLPSITRASADVAFKLPAGLYSKARKAAPNLTDALTREALVRTPLVNEDRGNYVLQTDEEILGKYFTPEEFNQLTDEQKIKALKKLKGE